MAPEQARGEPADARSDLFALGCVLFEMTAGRAAFRRATPAETMGALLRDEPDWSALPEEPAGLLRLLEHLLAKEPHARRRDAADVAIELDDLAAELGSATRMAAPEAPASPRHRALPIAIAAIALVGVGLVAVRFRQAPEPPLADPAAALELVPLTTDVAVEEWPTFSADGSQVAFVRERDGLRQLVVRTVATGEERWLTSGELDAIQPSFVPGGEAVVYVRSRAPAIRLEPSDPFGWFDRADLWRLELAGGEPRRLAELAFHPDVSPDGERIVVEADWSGTRRLWLLDARGLNREQLTSDTSEAVIHLAPRFSPDGRAVVFQSNLGAKSDIRIVDLETNAQTAVTDDAEPDYLPDWTADGRAIVFSSYRSGGINLWRVDLDAALRPTGRPVQVTQGPGRTCRSRRDPPPPASRSPSCARTPTSGGCRSIPRADASRASPSRSSPAPSRTAGGIGPPTGARSPSTRIATGR
jgi:eukaryotic-like serine/threonine-protein kinase